MAAHALSESLALDKRISEAIKGFVPSVTDSVYSPFEKIATELGYTGDPTLEPSPFFTTLHGYAQLD
jgi:hypothetical protein